MISRYYVRGVGQKWTIIKDGNDIVSGYTGAGIPEYTPHLFKSREEAIEYVNKQPFINIFEVVEVFVKE